MNEVATITTSDLQIQARAIASSGLFSIKNESQALALMLIAHAEGRHPALVALDYDIISGRPAKRAIAMQRDFLASGGKITWIKSDNQCAEAIFSHPQGGELKESYTMEDAKLAGLAYKDNWKKFPKAMLRARVLSSGIRAVYPHATSGMYVPEEVQDFEPKEDNNVIDVQEEPLIIEHLITEEQVNTILDLTLATNTNIEAMCKFYKAKRVEEIKSNQYDSVIAKLKQKLKNNTQANDAKPSQEVA